MPICPTPSELAAFARGGLDPASHSTIADHVQSCPLCERLIKESDAAKRAGADAGRTISLDRAATTPRPADLPEKIGRYFVVSLLGQGGFANVYLARDGADERRLVAIKVLKRDNDESERATVQFLREARTAAELTHPNIVQVFDWGRDDRVGCYVVMQHVAGGTLSDIYKAGRIEFDPLCDILIATAEALVYAHSKGLVHRDVKPANILVPKHAAQHAYLSDFGLAFEEKERWTQGAVPAGTPCYMAPEQIRGQSALYHGLGDVWSFGVVLYEGLTGRRPFSGGTRQQMFDDIQRGVPRSPREIEPRVPTSLERLCLQCLEKQPENRCKISEVLSRLHRWRRRRRLRRWLLPAAGAVMMLAMLIGSAAAFVANRPQKPIDDAGRNGGGSRKKSLAEVAPAAVFHSGNSRDNHFRVNDIANTLQLVSTNLYLVKLGTIDRSDCEIGVTIEFSTKGKEAGIFIGYRDRQADTLRQFHLINLEKPEVGEPYSRRRMQVFKPDDPASRSTKAFLVGAIAGEIQQRNRVSLQLGNGQVKRIVWNGEPVEERGADVKQPEIGDVTGAFGVFSNEVAAVFSHFEIDKEPKVFVSNGP